MTKLFILRHGEAVSRAPTDAQRPLTEQGQQQVRSMAERHLAALQQVDTALVSPFLRAQQTAALVLEQLADHPASQASPLLQPNAEPAELIDWLYRQGEQNFLLVSHQPLVSRLISLLAYGHERGDTPMSVASLACLNVDVMAAGCAELEWIDHID